MEHIGREELLERHRGEKKILQGRSLIKRPINERFVAQVQSLKHAVPKGDKKRKKDVQQQIDQLEQQLRLKHEAELKLLSAQDGPDADEAAAVVDDTAAFLDRLTMHVASDDDEPKDNPQQPVRGERVSKAQKRRDRKQQQEKERQERIANEDVSHLNSAKQAENEAFQRILTARGLRVVQIPSDGDCMYASLAHQLRQLGRALTVQQLRDQTAEYIRQHHDDFIPFLVDEKTGELLDRQQFDEYCAAISDTKAWGGQVELQALVQILDCPIEVLQANGAELVLGDPKKSSARLTISYHRHAYQLGEHYNSVVPAASST